MSLGKYRENGRGLYFRLIFHFNYHSYVLTVWSFCDQGAWSHNINVVSSWRKQEGASKTLAKANQSRRSSFSPLYDPRIYDAIFWHCGSFYIFRMHVLCCAARVPRDEGDETGRECKRGWRRMIPVRNGVDERAFHVWSLDSPLHAAFKLYFSPSPKITFVRYSISPRDGEAPGKMTGMVSGEFSQAPYIAIKDIRKIMRNRNTLCNQKNFST